MLQWLEKQPDRTLSEERVDLEAQATADLHVISHKRSADWNPGWRLAGAKVDYLSEFRTYIQKARNSFSIA